VSRVSCHLEHVAIVRLTRECDQELAGSKWRVGENECNVTSNRIRRDPLEWEGEPGLEDSKGLPLEVRGTRASLKNGAGKGSSQERDKGGELCSEHGNRNVGTLRGKQRRQVDDAQARMNLYVNARTGRKLRRDESSGMYAPHGLRSENAALVTIIVCALGGKRVDVALKCSAYGNP